MRSPQAQTRAVVFEAPRQLSLRSVRQAAATDSDVVVQVDCSGISTGTERLLWEGAMPPFPGLAYPLVPGYEAAGSVIAAGSACHLEIGSRVFVPGCAAYQDGVRGLFGAAASALVVPESRVTPLQGLSSESATLLALAATAMHLLSHRLDALHTADTTDLAHLRTQAPELIVGHGVLGRLLARLCLAIGAPAPVVWETRPERRHTTDAYKVVDPADDDRHDYRCICDVSGAGGALFDQLIARLARRGRLILGGFYREPVQFTFPPAFMREVQMNIAAEWAAPDMHLVTALAEQGTLSLDDLVSHREPVDNATLAYDQAFNDGDCLKMVLDWREA